MKFLCVLCDQPMKLVEMAPPDRGALAIVYECPECAHRVAMLTNPLETQVVTSLGVQIGPGQGDISKCPFSGMVQEMTGGAAASDVAAGEASPGEPAIVWTSAALERLQRIPDFVRPMARSGIEKYAQDKGLSEIDETVLDHAKDFFGM
jgi:proto-chlorophyllide reductase subunit